MISRICLLAVLLVATQLQAENAQQYTQWLEQMREQPRGPFSRLRWFCNDGTILPPKAYACSPHGGGHQHGQWSSRTLQLREQGYLVANLLAGIEPAAMLAQPDFDNDYGQRLIEKFLIAVDDGWIMRRALFYRGAIQDEDERAGARLLLHEMLSQPSWFNPHFLAVRTGVRLLPHGEDTASVGRVRKLSASLSDIDQAFMPIRIKIHGAPDASDAQTVRQYSEHVTDTMLRQRYASLAQEIDKIYQAEPLTTRLLDSQRISWMPASLKQLARRAATQWPAADPAQKMALSGALMAGIRDALESAGNAERRLDLMDASLQIEAEHFRNATEVRLQLPQLTRAQLLQVLAAAGDAAYGSGLLNARLHSAQRQRISQAMAGTINVEQYRDTLAYLNRAPGWALQAMRRYFYTPMTKLAEVEPLALLFIQDQLRGSPMLFYSQALNLLAQDAGRLAGIRHRLFGRDYGAGFTPLNPGLARGTLHTSVESDELESLNAQGIYLLPETVSDLPPVAGILTAGAGNPLSHVQLLARNLGIPNVSVGPQAESELKLHDGAAIVLAVSPGGLVEISEDSASWQQMFDQQQSAGIARIVPDLDKLDLSLRRPVSIDALQATDSGRTVGPKAAKLAELRKHYPEAVSRGVAIPFGVFKAEVLDQRHRSGSSLFEWMKASYRRLESLPPRSEELASATEAFRAELYAVVLNTQLSDSFIKALQESLDTAFGGQVTGLFVRSDTNVEDLAGFTGAGLNLTLPNVVGQAQLLDSIPRVWASPFTARAFSWRQALMDQPEHVYTSILLLESVGSDKSGVLVTADIDSGASGTLSVAINEGLGGAVDGQAAESLRIPLADDAPVEVLATATAAGRRVLNAAGGIDTVPASGSDYVLTTSDIAQLREFGRSLPQRFPAITDDDGKPAPADVEFGFLDGRLRLFQLRPFLDSSAVQRNSYLLNMDHNDQHRLDSPVRMNEVPANESNH